MEQIGQRAPTAYRRDVVRAWCTTLPSGAPAAAVEAAAERTVASMAPARSHARRSEGPGVGERRYALEGRRLEDPGLDRGRAGRAEGRDGEDLAELLARRAHARGEGPGAWRGARRGNGRGHGPRVRRHSGAAPEAQERAVRMGPASP